MFVEKNRKYLNMKVFNSGEMLVKDMIHLPEYERPHKCDVCERRFCKKGPVSNTYLGCHFYVMKDSM